LFVRTVFTRFSDALQVAMAEYAPQALPLHDAWATCGTEATAAAVARRMNLRVTRIFLSGLVYSCHSSIHMMQAIVVEKRTGVVHW
jgi:hypothetical protein